MAQPYGQLSGRQRALTMGVVMLAMFLATLSQMSLATAMPVIVADLGGFDRYTWAATSYLVAATVAIPIAGRLADIHGRRIFFVLGLSIFIAASVPAGLSQTMTQLIAFRALQGIGGGIIMSNSAVAVADLYAPEERGKYVGLLGLVYAVAAVAGPVLAGVITDSASWNWIFLINVPLGIPVLLLLMRYFPRIAPAAGNRGLDYPGIVTLTLAVVAVMGALSLAGERYAWASPQVAGLLAFGLAMSAAFVAIESRSACPIMPLEIYRNRVVAAAVAVTFLTCFGLYGTILFTPLFFQGVQGTSATGSGAFLTPIMLGMVAGSVVSGQLLSRTGARYRLQAVVNTGLMTAGVYLLSTMDQETGYLQAIGYIVIMGLGMGGTLATLGVAVQNSVPFALVGIATSTLHFFRLVSGAAGLAVLGGVLTTRFSARFDQTVPGNVGGVLSAGELDAIKDNPRVLLDPSATEGLRAAFAEAGADGGRLADTFLAALNAALGGAMGDVFTVTAAVVGLAVAAALLMRANPR
ncbi:MAG: MFS transporter [Acidobacteria bacterium]|nr:MFS transporter [Acidobacteriota bacterium]